MKASVFFRSSKVNEQLLSWLVLLILLLILLLFGLEGVVTTGSGLTIVNVVVTSLVEGKSLCVVAVVVEVEV